MVADRREEDGAAMADVLSAASPGVSESFWDSLMSIDAKTLLIAGAPPPPLTHHYSTMKAFIPDLG
jgi:hypothetical protein